MPVLIQKSNEYRFYLQKLNSLYKTSFINISRMGAHIIVDYDGTVHILKEDSLGKLKNFKILFNRSLFNICINYIKHNFKKYKESLHRAPLDCRKFFIENRE